MHFTEETLMCLISGFCLRPCGGCYIKSKKKKGWIIASKALAKGLWNCVSFLNNENRTSPHFHVCAWKEYVCTFQRKQKKGTCPVGTENKPFDGVFIATLDIWPDTNAPLPVPLTFIFLPFEWVCQPGQCKRVKRWTLFPEILGALGAHHRLQLSASAKSPHPAPGVWRVCSARHVGLQLL